MIIRSKERSGVRTCTAPKTSLQRDATVERSTPSTLRYRSIRCLCLGSVLALAQQENDLDFLVGSQPDAPLQRGAWVEAHADPTRQRAIVPKCERPIEAAVATEELGSIGGYRHIARTQIGEGNPLPEVEIPRVSSEDGTGCLIPFGD